MFRRLPKAGKIVCTLLRLLHAEASRAQCQLVGQKWCGWFSVAHGNKCAWLWPPIPESGESGPSALSVAAVASCSQHAPRPDSKSGCRRRRCLPPRRFLIGSHFRRGRGVLLNCRIYFSKPLCNSRLLDRAFIKPQWQWKSDIKKKIGDWLSFQRTGETPLCCYLFWTYW